MKLFFKIMIFTSLGFGALAQEETIVKRHSITPYVDLRDVSFFRNNVQTQIIERHMQDNPQTYFPAGVFYNPQGVTKENRFNTVYGVELISDFLEYSDYTFTVDIRALYSSEIDGFVFKTLRVYYDVGAKAVAKVETLSTLPIIGTSFKTEVSISDHRLVLSDQASGIIKIYPMGVGGFDEKSVIPESLTPELPVAYLERANIIPERFNPEYYLGKPFFKISDSQRRIRSEGIHISTTPTSLFRGHISHGCMHLREKDLYELFALLSYGVQEIMPLSIVKHSNFKLDHLYPHETKRYTRIQYVNGKTLPDPMDARLKAMEVKEEKPPTNFRD